MAIKVNSRTNSRRDWRNRAHDRFFKFVFAKQPRRCAELMTLVLTMLQQELVDLSSIKMVPTESLDDNLRLYFCDVVFCMDLKGTSEPARIYVVLEHKSTKRNHEILSQMFRYLSELDRQGDAIVFGVVVYNGKDADYQGPDEFILSKKQFRRLPRAHQELVSSLCVNFKLLFLNLRDYRSIQDRIDEFTLDTRMLLKTMGMVFEENTSVQEEFCEEVHSRFSSNFDTEIKNEDENCNFSVLKVILEMDYNGKSN